MTSSALPPTAIGPAAPAAARPVSGRERLLAGLARARAVLHAIMGVPDYERYVAHLREHHPGCPVPSAREFERERMSARYERPGSRCC